MAAAPSGVRVPCPTATALQAAQAVAAKLSRLGHAHANLNGLASYAPRHPPKPSAFAADAPPLELVCRVRCTRTSSTSSLWEFP
jgi:hypothetical protein